MNTHMKCYFFVYDKHFQIIKFAWPNWSEYSMTFKINSPQGRYQLIKYEFMYIKDEGMLCGHHCSIKYLILTEYM